MDKNLVVSLDEIKGIRLQCKECESEVVVSPTKPLLIRTHLSTRPMAGEAIESGRRHY